MISIQNRHRTRKVSSWRSKEILERLLQELSLDQTEVSVVFVSDATISKYHRIYFADPSPTDVISFPTELRPPLPAKAGRLPLNKGEILKKNPLPLIRGGLGWGPRHLGDIMISLDTASRNARRAGKPFWDEIKLLLAHGLLHLKGYDHATKAQKAKMWRLQSRLLKQVRSL